MVTLLRNIRPPATLSGHEKATLFWVPRLTPLQRKDQWSSGVSDLILPADTVFLFGDNIGEPVVGVISPRLWRISAVSLTLISADVAPPGRVARNS